MPQNSEPFDPAKGGTQDGPETRNSSSNGRVVRLKKPHPCGGSKFTIVRESVIVTLKCNTCGAFVRIPREKYTKVLRDKW